MSKFKDSGSDTTTEYQATVVDPNIGENTQVQCANCGSWRPNSRLYCPVCGARNVVATSEFLSEEDVLAKAGMSASELKASIREPAKEKKRRQLYMVLAFALLLIGGLWWANQSREADTRAKLAEQQAQAAVLAQQKAQALAAEKAKEAASAAAVAAATAALAAASAPLEAASAPILTDEQATKLGLATAAPKRKPEPAPIVVAPAPVIVAQPEPAPEPPKPKPEPVAVAKEETPVERLNNAVVACKSKGGFFERNACEFEARKRFCPPLEGKVRECPIQTNTL
jgi:uncharacterized Zn finger protein (UPF0148 family)